MRRRVAAAVVAVATAAALLAGCTSGLGGAPASAGTVTVAVTEPLTSLNPATSYGDTATNRQVASLTRTGFGYDDDRYRLVRDTSFGRARILSRSPFRVRYTVAAGRTWSDGAPLDARDLLLSWAAGSGALNAPGFDPSPYVDASTGRFTSAFPTDVTWFDGTDADLASITRMPTIGSDDRSIDVTYAAFSAAWPIALEPTLPAHVVAAHALDAHGSASDRSDALVGAIRSGGSDLAAVSRYWNDAGITTTTPRDRDLLVASGPYRVSSVSASTVVLTANPRYRGSREPVTDRIRLRVIADPLAQAAALRSGAIDVATPAPSAEAVKALIDTPGAKVTQGAQGRFEHLDLRIAGSASGVFANADVRRAFLHVVPRAEIVRELVQPVNPEAQPLRSFTLPPGGDDYARSVRANGSAAYADVDVAAAERLLARSGVASPEVCILYDPADERRRAEFALIRSSAARAGFRVTDCSSPRWRSLVAAPGSSDAVLDAWDASEIGTVAAATKYSSGAGSSTATGFADPRVDALVAELGTASSAGQREILARIDADLWADAYGAPLFQYPAVAAVDRRVAHVSLSPLEAGVFWNAWEWSASGVARS